MTAASLLVQNPAYRVILFFKLVYIDVYFVAAFAWLGHVPKYALALHQADASYPSDIKQVYFFSC